jgi:NADH dehydrogenase (ubiquinone) Fe-S protein 2
MASILLRRRLAPTATRVIQRHISTTVARRDANIPEKITNREIQNIHETHVVEGMTAEEILAETGSGKDSKMRHFTGTLLPRCILPTMSELLCCDHLRS